jgi:hypothetical protein
MVRELSAALPIAGFRQSMNAMTRNMTGFLFIFLSLKNFEEKTNE